MMVDQNKVKEILSELEAQISNIDEYSEYVEAMESFETIKEILQMN